MASEQTGARKKQSRNLSKEEVHHPLLYRHQNCIPNPKVLQNCERHTLPGLKSNKEPDCIEKKLSSENEANNLKNKIKQVKSKVKNDGKSDKAQQVIISNPQQSNVISSNNEELSKSRKRRLRKRRLLVALAPPSSNPKPTPSVENNQPIKPISRTIARPNTIVPPTSGSTTAIRTSDANKTSSVKDSRKRLDKSVGSRNKSIKKTLVDSAPQSKADIIKTLEEKTLNSLLQTLVPLTNSSPKKEKPPPTPLFSFPEKRLSSSDTKVDKDGVFYFGETKHQLEKLSSDFSKYNTSPVREKSECAQKIEFNGKNCFPPTKFSNLENCVSSFNFSPLVSDICSSLTAVKQNLFNTETVLPLNKTENKITFPIDYRAKEPAFISPVPNDLSQFPNELFNIPSPVCCSPFTNTTCSSVFETIDKILDISKPIEEPKHFDIASTLVLEQSRSVLAEELKSSQNSSFIDIKNNQSIMKPVEDISKPNKTREEIMLEREAKKLAKLAAKAKHKIKTEASNNETCKLENAVDAYDKKNIEVDTKDRKLDKKIEVTCQNSDSKVDNKAMILSDKLPLPLPKTEATNDVKTAKLSNDVGQDFFAKSKAELRAERRAKQEAQRAAKATSKPIQSQPKEKSLPQVNHEPPKMPIVVKPEKKLDITKAPAQPKPRLFSHLHQEKTLLSSNKILNVGGLHPAIVTLGAQYAARVVVGSNARCVALLHALKQMVNDYTTPTEKEFSRGLEEELKPVTVYLNQCRPLAVSMNNALRHIKRTLTKLPNNIPDVEARQKICEVMDTYIHEQIDMACRAICNTVKPKIADGDVILTYGCSSLVYKILVESHLSGTKFRVVIVDGLPWREGREMLRRLVEKGLSCTYVLITAASFIMREASKVLLGAHALLANGYVMSRAGNSQVALLAHCYNVPVLVCCETHKFCERVQTDAFVYNELGELCCDNIKEKCRASTSLTPLSLAYDITPPDLVSSVVTELSVLPCTSVPVVLRIKPESVM